MAYGFAQKSEKRSTTAKQTLQEWVSFFEVLEDPRGKQGREHDFLSIIMIAILAVIAGAEGWDDIASPLGNFTLNLIKYGCQNY
jgi:hypothetical protein